MPSASDNHDTTHQHDLNHTGQRGLYFAAAIKLAYAAIEAGVGWWGYSLALLSDAGRMLTDTSALLIAAPGS